MATIKSFTSLQQSKKLAEILPLESADMKWYFWKSEIDAPKTPTFGYSKSTAESYKDTEAVYFPCWSFAALLDVLTENKICHYDDRYYCQYISEGGEFPIYSTAEYDNPVDACYELILKLNKLNLL